MAEKPNIEMYAWCEELAIVTDQPEPTDEAERDELHDRAFELIENLMSAFAATASIRPGHNHGKVLPEDLAEWEQNCEDVGEKIGYPRAADGARLLIERYQAEVAHRAIMQ
jgi:hypothetical protein